MGGGGVINLKLNSPFNSLVFVELPIEWVEENE